MLLSLAVLAVGGRRVSRPNLFPAILFVLLASLPALPLLLIGSDLAGARVLYLPSIGISLFWMLVVRSVKHPPLYHSNKPELENQLGCGHTDGSANCPLRHSAWGGRAPWQCGPCCTSGREFARKAPVQG